MGSFQRKRLQLTNSNKLYMLVGKLHGTLLECSHQQENPELKDNCGCPILGPTKRNEGAKKCCNVDY